MTTQPPSPSPTGKKALLDAFGDVMRSQVQTQLEEAAARQAAARARARRQRVMWLVAVALIGVNGYIWAARPAWLFPPPAPGESTEMKEASLRVGMATVARKVEQFRERHGRLPASLTEAGASLEGIRYRVADTTYTLTGVNGPVALSLTSADSLAVFVGDSYRLITRRAGR